MKSKQRWVAALIILGLAGWRLHDHASGDNESAVEKAERDSLQGLKGVFVVLEEIKPDGESAERDGLSRLQIKTDIELRLRKAGIRVLNADEFSREPGKPYLYVNLGLFRIDDDQYVFTLHVDLLQDVRLNRNPAILCLGSRTWTSPSSFGRVGIKRLNACRESVIDRVDQFANAFLAANPPQDATQATKP